MGRRTEFVEGMQSILGKSNFRYGSYESRPLSLPYGLYFEDPQPYFYADDKPWIKIKYYIIRVVSEQKDFELEELVETLMEQFDIPYQKITDEYIKTEKVWCSEWEGAFLP